ncbi:hypothetical protein RRG08_049966 [Elysia crispata]|uniref:Fibronectin type-III domain-containing protein n=1 Tax=Elysia crispata TaxID=231223 RepID=A0AAE1E8D8_9GAST|nr:hypothetical protein RRG08_049966 [Elysia crispata]
MLVLADKGCQPVFIPLSRILQTKTADASITGLTAYSEYDVRVRYINEQGEGPWCQPFYLKTTQGETCKRSGTVSLVDLGMTLAHHNKNLHQYLFHKFQEHQKQFPEHLKGTLCYRNQTVNQSLLARKVYIPPVGKASDRKDQHFSQYLLDEPSAIVPSQCIALLCRWAEAFGVSLASPKRPRSGLRTVKMLISRPYNLWNFITEQN